MMEDRYDSKVQDEFNLKFREESMWPDFYASTFYAMITKHKNKYGLLDEDVTEYFFESLFLLMTMSIFCIAILLNVEWTRIIDIHINFPL